MTKLFILGNGFDLSHGINTSYSDFKRYLMDTYSIDNVNNLPNLPTPTEYSDGSERYDDTEVATYIVNLINITSSYNEWHDLEYKLAELDYDSLFLFNEHYDKSGEINHWRTLYNNEDIGASLENPTIDIGNYFEEWINSIDLKKDMKNEVFESLINSDDLFLTFNYTDTLEKIYNIPRKNICHIHGEQNEKIYFGHGDNSDSTNSYMRTYYGAEDNLATIKRTLYKDTDEALSLNYNFFELMSHNHIDEIYAYGFSFNEIDKIYIEEICKLLNTQNMTCYLHDFNTEDHKEYQKMLINCGYEGNFSTFSDRIHIIV